MPVRGGHIHRKVLKRVGTLDSYERFCHEGMFIMPVSLSSFLNDLFTHVGISLSEASLSYTCNFDTNRVSLNPGAGGTPISASARVSDLCAKTGLSTNPPITCTANGMGGITIQFQAATR